MLDDLLTPAEVAALLRVKPQTVYRLVREKKLPGVKTGGSVRVSRSELEAWLARNRVGATPPADRRKAPA